MRQRLHKDENLLNQDFHADRPYRKQVTDISDIQTKQDLVAIRLLRGEKRRRSLQSSTSTVIKVLSKLHKHGITPSMSRRVNLYDNALAENLFGILKTRVYLPA